MSRIPIAVVGFGRFGRMHAKCLVRHADFELVCVVDPSLEARNDAQAMGIEALPDAAGLPKHLRAATVATPSDTHAVVALDMLKRGLDILIEKPLATCEADISQILLTAQQSDRLVCTGHIERFGYLLGSAKRFAGQPVFAEFHRQSRASGQGKAAVLDLVVHDLDLAAYLFNISPGAPIEVSRARLGAMDIDVTVVIDNLVLRFYAAYGATHSRANVRLGASSSYKMAHAKERPHPVARRPDMQGMDPLARQYSAFGLALRGHASPIADADAGAVAVRRALAILEAI